MQCEIHGYNKLGCPGCRKDQARWEKDRCEWGLFVWRGDRQYDRKDALNGKFYKSQKVADNRARALNETPEAHALPGGGYVVRPVLK